MGAIEGILLGREVCGEVEGVTVWGCLEGREVCGEIVGTKVAGESVGVDV